jgi:hypothetical protein
MKKSEYQVLLNRIEQRYQDDLAALERINALWVGEQAPVAATSGPDSRSVAMKASWARRRANKPGDEKAPSRKKLSEFLTNGADN